MPLAANIDDAGAAAAMKAHLEDAMDYASHK